ncbi:hypothetical protein B795N_12270 [Marinilactibacillus psychrotolerans]|nr:hypothetical protein B795N_12270 [Marinilactibacillus psychrotolerans]
MNDVIKVQGFSNIDLKDEFFDSLKDDYPGFENWFEKKQTRGAEAFVIYYEKKISGFLYLVCQIKLDGFQSDTCS